MADSKLTDDQVAGLVNILRSDASLDAKIQYVTAVKSGIKQHNVPDTCIPQVFDGLRTASTSQHAALVNAGFTALNHLLTRLSRQEPKYLAKEAARTVPVVVDKLGDQKDKFRTLAMQALITLYAVAPADVDRSVRNSAMGGKNSRAKEAALQWLLTMHNDHGMPFRGYVPILMDLLEDADGMVRDATKGTVIELFRNAPNAAKSDLKRQLKNFKVRPAIEQAIVKALVPTAGRQDAPPEIAAAPSRPALSASMSSLPVERPVTPAPEPKTEAVEPMYVNTNRELDDMFRDAAGFFEGKETEQNWLKREQFMGTLRRLCAGNAPSEFFDTFLAGLRSMLDGIIKCMVSLRTSVSKEGCSLVQELAITLGPGMDPMVELLMQTLVKLSAGTKKISSQQANATVDTILSRVTYSARLMQHIWMACQDKNVQPRMYATGWLKTMLKKEAGHKSHVEHTGGVDLIEKCIKKCLGDANPGVREKMRSTFWAFWGVWPARAEAIMADLEPTAQKLLNKDPSNPNGPSKSEAASTVRPGLGLSKSTMGPSKPSLRDHVMAQKKAKMTAKDLPARPGSAMSHFSPVKNNPPSFPTSSSSTGAKVSGATRTRQEPTISVNASGMSVAPMRPARRRGEMAPRPATAGPYSVRDQPDSPESIRSKNVTPKPRETTPRRTAQRPQSRHGVHASESSIPSPGARSTTRSLASPRVSPAKFNRSQSALPDSSPSRANEDFSLVVPNLANIKAPPIPEPEPLVPHASEALPEPVTAPVVVEPELVLNEIASQTDASESMPAEMEPLMHTSKTYAEPTPGPGTPSRNLKVYEDPNVDDQVTPKPVFTGPVLEDKPINEDAANLPKANGLSPSADIVGSPDKVRQNAKLLDSGIARIKARTLDVHGFRKLQSLLRDSKGIFTDEKFEALLVGLFEYLEDPLPSLTPEKAQDVKAQILATIRLLLKKERDNFQPHVSKGLESLLETRAAYDTRAHIVSGLELLADELVTIGDGSEIVVVLTRRLQTYSDDSIEGCRTLSTGLHVLRAMLEKRQNYMPTNAEISQLTDLAARCLISTDSGVRMDSVQLCVGLHARVGETIFWDALKDVQDDPKSLITYYIVKRQREQGIAPTVA